MKTVASSDSQKAHVATGGTPASAATADSPPHADAPVVPRDGPPGVTQPQPQPPAAAPPWQRYRRWLLAAGAVAALAVAGYFRVPWVRTVLSTVSTDDAYVNGHMTFVAPRVKGQVVRVLGK